MMHWVAYHSVSMQKDTWKTLGHLYLMPVMSIFQDNFHPEVTIKKCGYF